MASLSEELRLLGSIFREHGLTSAADKTLTLAQTAADLEEYPCEEVHQDPFNFDQCTTHDETFAIGTHCPFNGKRAADVYSDRADANLGRATRAEMLLDELIEATDNATPVIDFDQNGQERHGIPVGDLSPALDRWRDELRKREARR